MRRSDIIERLNEAELRRAVDFGKALDVIGRLPSAPRHSGCAPSPQAVSAIRRVSADAECDPAVNWHFEYAQYLADQERARSVNGGPL